jgi:hypothetical protein
MQRRPFAILILLMLLLPVTTSAAGWEIRAGEGESVSGPGLASAARMRPSIGIRPGRALPPSIWPNHRGIPPFGSVQGGLETGIGFGYPAPYPTGGGTRMGRHRWFGSR